MIQDNTIQEIKNRIDIEEVVSDFVSLKRKGQNLWACCPFHNEKTPSFSVSPAKGFYKCFGCGKSGDSIAFIMEMEKVTYPEALRYLAKKYGIEIKEEELTPDELREQSERDSLYIVLNYANEQFVKNLHETPEGKSIGLSYFKEREVSDEILTKFELGYAVDQWDGLLNRAKEDGHNPQLMEKAGLIIPKDDRHYDRFRGRVIFPIHNVSGRVVAFGARALKKDDKPKYINSPETPVYHKSQVLYGLFQAKQAIRQEQNCYLVEGYTDVTRLHQIGIENVVASSGTSLTEEQVRAVGRFSKQLTVLYDGDSAGLKASLRGVDIILANGLDVKVVMFPEGHDPDSYAQEVGANEFKQFLVSKAEDFIRFRVRLLAEEAGNDPVKKVEAIKDVVQSIGQIPDQVKRSVYIQEASGMLQIEERVLVGELNKTLISKNKPLRQVAQATQVEVVPEKTPEKTTSASDKYILLEQAILKLLLDYGDKELEDGYKLADKILAGLNSIEDQVFIDPANLEILKEIERQHNADGINPVFFVKNADMKIRNLVIDLIHDRYEVSQHWFERHRIHVPTESDPDVLNKISDIVMLRYQHSRARMMIDENLKRLKEAKSHDEEQEVQQIHQELKFIEKEIARKLGNVILK